MRRFSGFWFFMASCALIAGPVRAETVGMVLSVEGGAQLVRGGESQTLLLGDLLQAGDRVTVPASGKLVFLFCPASERVTLAGGSGVELAADGLKATQGPPPTRAATRRCTLPKVALGEESTERIGGLVARGLPPIPIYLGGAVASVQPVFAWAAVEGSPSYEVSVRDQWGKVVWEVEADFPQLAYPADQPPLEAGKYQWEVVARVGGETVAQQAARFQVKPDPELAQLRPETPGDQLLAAVELENAGYFAEAGGWVRALREANPKDARLTQRLMVLYWNAGLIPAANQERARLEELEKSGSGN